VGERKIIGIKRERKEMDESGEIRHGKSEGRKTVRT
jgi:hypothetical protein